MRVVPRNVWVRGSNSKEERMSVDQSPFRKDVTVPRAKVSEVAPRRMREGVDTSRELLSPEMQLTETQRELVKLFGDEKPVPEQTLAADLINIVEVYVAAGKRKADQAKDPWYEAQIVRLALAELKKRRLTPADFHPDRNNPFSMADAERKANDPFALVPHLKMRDFGASPHSNPFEMADAERKLNLYMHRFGVNKETT